MVPMDYNIQYICIWVPDTYGFLANGWTISEYSTRRSQLLPADVEIRTGEI
jgi:hypothetical protein